MEIDYKQHAVVLGTAQRSAYFGCGKIAEGALAKMITVALDHMEQRYVGVMIMVGGETWHPARIKEVAQRSDFPSS
jgi:hypothetical protein